MKKQFVPYELAVKLKELGFDENCFGFYQNDKSLTIGLEEADINHFTNKRALKNETYSCVAPLWQQAFDWFRKEHNLEGYTGLCYFKDMTYGYNVTNYISKSHYEAQDRGFGTYEEARLACLKKLIELCKNR